MASEIKSVRTVMLISYLALSHFAATSYERAKATVLIYKGISQNEQTYAHFCFATYHIFALISRMCAYGFCIQKNANGFAF